MTATTTALVPLQPAFSDAGRLALAGYRGLTREAYVLDLRQFTTWCRARSLSLFGVRRVGIEGFARDLEVQGPGRATVTWRLCTIAGSCKYAVEEDSSGTPGRSRPAAAGGLRVSCRHPDRNELGALLVAAGRIVRKTARCAGIGKTVTPHTLRHAVTASLDAGVPLRDLHMSAGCAAWPAYLCAGGQIGE